MQDWLANASKAGCTAKCLPVEMCAAHSFRQLGSEREEEDVTCNTRTWEQCFNSNKSCLFKRWVEITLNAALRFYTFFFKHDLFPVCVYCKSLGHVNSALPSYRFETRTHSKWHLMCKLQKPLYSFPNKDLAFHPRSISLLSIQMSTFQGNGEKCRWMVVLFFLFCISTQVHLGANWKWKYKQMRVNAPIFFVSKMNFH